MKTAPNAVHQQLLQTGIMKVQQGNSQEALGHLEEVLANARRARDVVTSMYAATWLAEALCRATEPIDRARVLSLRKEALVLAQESQDVRVLKMLPTLMAELAHSYEEMGMMPAATDLYRAAVAQSRITTPAFLLSSLRFAAMHFLNVELFDESEKAWREIVELERLGGRPNSASLALWGRSLLLAGRSAEAATTIAEAIQLVESRASDSNLGDSHGLDELRAWLDEATIDVR